MRTPLIPIGALAGRGQGGGSVLRVAGQGIDDSVYDSLDELVRLGEAFVEDVLPSGKMARSHDAGNTQEERSVLSARAGGSSSYIAEPNTDCRFPIRVYARANTPTTRRWWSVVLPYVATDMPSWLGEPVDDPRLFWDPEIVSTC